jgi:hypothetical protein
MFQEKLHQIMMPMLGSKQQRGGTIRLLGIDIRLMRQQKRRNTKRSVVRRPVQQSLLAFAECCIEIGTQIDKEVRQRHVPIRASQTQGGTTIEIPSMHIRPASRPYVIVPCCIQQLIIRQHSSSVALSRNDPRDDAICGSWCHRCVCVSIQSANKARQFVILFQSTNEITKCTCCRARAS